jgi:hypothetical protein
MKIEYRKVGDYYLPNVTIPEELKKYKLGKYSSLRMEYLKQNKKKELRELIYRNKLNKHLNDVQVNCMNLREKLIEEYKKKDNITEELKATNQMEWVRKMNNISNIVDEIVVKEYVYNDEI